MCFPLSELTILILFKPTPSFLKILSVFPDCQRAYRFEPVPRIRASYHLCQVTTLDCRAAYLLGILIDAPLRLTAFTANTNLKLSRSGGIRTHDISLEPEILAVGITKHDSFL